MPDRFTLAAAARAEQDAGSEKRPAPRNRQHEQLTFSDFRDRPDPNTRPAEEPENESSGDYTVGYGRPPVHTRFRPGVSGNPKGRPKGGVGLKSLVRGFMTDKVPVRSGGVVIKMSRAEAVLYKLFELALKGDLRAQSQLLKYYAAAVPEPPVNLSELEAEQIDEGALTIEALARDFLKKARGEKA